MKPITIFYSWQSDRGSDVCRRFAHLALAAAIAAIQPDFEVPIVLDSDTAGVAGTPPVTETILRKIRGCDVFVADMTFVAITSAGKHVPNPNVLTEYGYARARLADEQIVLLMNEAFGPPTELPFDLRHLRHPQAWNVAEGSPDADRRRIRAAFASRLESVLSASIRHVLARRSAASVPSADLAIAYQQLTELASRSGRGDVPAIVPGPRLIVRVAAANPPDDLDPMQVKTVRNDFVPEGYSRAGMKVGPTQWASVDPLKSRSDGLNPEARWYVRLVEPCALEASITVGRRIDDDPEIVVDGRRLEGRVVEVVRRLAGIASSLGVDGPVVASIALQDTQEMRLMSARHVSPMLQLPGIHLGEVDAPSPDVTPVMLRKALNRVWLSCGFEDGSPSYVDGAWQGDVVPALYEPVHIAG